MSNCRDKEVQLACFTPDDGSDSITINHTVIYDNDGVPVATYFSDRTGTVIDETTYLGGGDATLGDCPESIVECVESQEWTYGIDNTGTRFNDVATYKMTLSDGTSFTWSQNGSSTSWTPQLIEWSANIQQAADNAGLAWFVEPRAVNNVTPTDISGDYGSTPTGLPGAPSEPVAVALINEGMVARYVNIQICPGQPVPVSAERIDSDIYTNNPYSLTTAGAVKGPLQKFFVCRNCGFEPKWFLSDGVTEAATGQIPNCFEPCGVLSQLPSPPESDCTFEIDVACDNNNSVNTVDFTNTITRRATVCNGQQIAVDYFQADPSDPSALVAYSLNGDFVDCASGEPVALPVPECSDFVVESLFVYTEGTGDPLNREWFDTFDDNSTFGDTAYGDNVRESHDFNLPVTTNPGSGSFFAPNDTNNTAAVGDLQVIEGFMEVTNAISIRYDANSEGYIALEVGECCGPLDLKMSHAKGLGSAPSPTVDLPAGIHKFRLWNIDLGGSNSNWNIQSSADGINFVLGASEIIVSATKPSYDCVKVKICKDTGAMIDLLTDVVYDPSNLRACAPDCMVETSVWSEC